MDKIIKALPNISAISSEQLDLNISFLELCNKFVDDKGTIMLMSGGTQETSQYHILAIDPWMTIRYKNKHIQISHDTVSTELECDPFDFLDELLIKYELQFSEKEGDQLLPTGLLGYLSYDMKDQIENLPRTSVDDLYLPDIYFVIPRIILVHDIKNSKTIMNIFSVEDDNDQQIEEIKDVFLQKLKTPDELTKKFEIWDHKSNFSKTTFENTVKMIRDYIKAGDVYQVNLAQRFMANFSGQPFSLFKYLLNQNPASFFAFINAGDHQVISTSPERFLKLAGGLVETCPIKGTRPRGKNKKQDNLNKQELFTDKKEDAELSMIVDLMRNDLGKVCQAGSVKVIEHKKIEAYDNVFHLVSKVEGRLEENRNAIDLVKASFPGGSITGCPKIRSMEIIDELEPHRRHVYTGAIGYIGFNKTMDLNIAIRTATIVNKNILFSVGGGIVFDSVPESEYYETLAKGKTFLSAQDPNNSTMTHENKEYVGWMNGRIKPLSDLSIPFSDLGLQYGYGIFETIRIQDGTPMFLDQHLERFKSAWNTFFSFPVPDLSWDIIVKEVINANNTNSDIWSMKILATAGSRTKAPYDNSIIITARPYSRDLTEISNIGLKLITYPDKRQTPLADHKTMNYMYYYLASRYAEKQGADEAIILNSDNSVSETNSGNIILVKGSTVVIPESVHSLPGVMQKNTLEFLKDLKFEMVERVVSINDLYNCDEVIVSNSLMGAIHVSSIDSKILKGTSKISKKINEEFNIR